MSFVYDTFVPNVSKSSAPPDLCIVMAMHGYRTPDVCQLCDEIYYSCIDPQSYFSLAPWLVTRFRDLKTF